MFNPDPLCFIDTVMRMRGGGSVIFEVGLQRLELLRLTNIGRGEESRVDRDLEHSLKLVVLFVEVVLDVGGEVGCLFLLLVLFRVNLNC